MLRGTAGLLATHPSTLEKILSAVEEPGKSQVPSSQSFAPPDRARWLEIAEQCKPTLSESVQSPLTLVRPVPDKSLYLRWRMQVVAPAAELAQKTFRPGESFILDFGGHRTGYLAFKIRGVGENVDAPARLRLVFGQVPGDVAEPLHPYRGTLGEGWLPEEIVTIDYLPQSVRLPRRYAFRYVKVEIIGTSPKYAAQFSEIQARAVTCATQTPPPLPLRQSEAIQRIDEVSLATLRDCMQTTFEDGPRRDQRLWIGDMRLQAAANYETFKNYDLVKRCLYLFAAFPREDGLLRACVFEKPMPAASGDFILDYAVLYVAALYDYVRATGDKKTGADLWATARRQLEIVGATVGEDGLFVDPKNIWIFIDWEVKLERTASMHGVLLYCYLRAASLAELLGHSDQAAAYRTTAAKMKAAAQKHFYDESKQVYVSGDSRQLSLASQAWLILADVPDKSMGANALRRALAHSSVTTPTTPYLYHHVVSAMLYCGMKEEGIALIEQYWGGMVAAGADTFWEVYSPSDSLASPYGDVHINSFCHAWSCTPALLLRSDAS